MGIRGVRLSAAAACAVLLLLGAMVATAGAAFPGENGKVAFVRSPAGGDDEILTVEPSGGGQVALTDNAVSDGDPSYSADGERIVFTGDTGVETAIVVMDADGQNPVELTRGPSVTEPSFSPDGKRIVFRRYDGNDGEIVVMDTDGQNQVQLTDDSVPDGDPAFSPDGQRIVFSRAAGGDDEIFIMTANGENPVPLTNNGVSDTDPDFSPDGQRIVFTRNFGFNGAEIFAMDASGQNQTPLTTNAVNDFEAVFSPDGRRILFVRTNAADFYELYTMDPDGQNAAMLPYTPESGAYDDSPTWQPLNSPAFDLSGAAKQRSAKVVTVTVVSQNEDATVALGGTVRAPKRPRAAGASAKSKTFQLSPQTIELQPGQPVTVSLAVPKKARKLLKRGFAAGKKGKATVTATAADALGGSSQDSQQVKLKKKKRK
jgi:dipeptidyl aminopeptidase/acylaminoacyl peptidase